MGWNGPDQGIRVKAKGVGKGIVWRRWIKVILQERVSNEPYVKEELAMDERVLLNEVRP